MFRLLNSQLIFSFHYFSNKHCKFDANVDPRLICVVIWQEVEFDLMVRALVRVV